MRDFIPNTHINDVLGVACETALRLLRLDAKA